MLTICRSYLIVNIGAKFTVGATATVAVALTFFVAFTVAVWVMRSIGCDYLSKFAQKRRLEFVGHYIRSDNQPVGKLCIWEAAHKPLCKGKGRKMTYKKLILSDLPDMEFQEISAAARNREIGRV